MFEEYIPICFTVHVSKQIPGRKRFQKIVFLLKELGMPFNENFEWNNYGPFSKELASKIDTLCKMNLLEEHPIQNNDIKEYQYSLTDKGLEFFDSILSSNKPLYSKLKNILSTLNKYDTQELEKIASIKFLINRGYDLDYMSVFLEYTKNYQRNEVEAGKESMEELFKAIKTT